MAQLPDWGDLSKSMADDLNYSSATIKRYRNTYNVFRNDYYSKYDGTDAISCIEQCKQMILNDYETGSISYDKLSRLRRLESKISQLLKQGSLNWEQLPSHSKRYACHEYENLIHDFLSSDKWHAKSICYRNEGIIRQFVLYLGDSSVQLSSLDEPMVDSFMRHMHKQRPAGLKSIVSALKAFLHYLYECGYHTRDLSLIVYSDAILHQKIYGIFSKQEIDRILESIDRNTVIGKRDYAIFSLAADCGIRSSDISSLCLSDIDWRNSCISIVQSKTSKPLKTPFSIRTGDGISDYILNARQKSDLPYVFLKSSYTQTRMTSALLWQRLRKYMELAGVYRAAEDKIGIHTFRRSLGTNLAESGSTMELIAQILGHQGTSATLKYISYSEKMLSDCSLDLSLLPELEVADNE